MINPFKITNFNRNERELAEFLFFGVAVAGKRSVDIAEKVNALPYCPSVISRWKSEKILPVLKHAKIGKYGVLLKFMQSLPYVNLSEITLEELLILPGVGPKTARFFLLHSRPNQKYVVLDTHLCKFFRSKGVFTQKVNPNNYEYLEKRALMYLAAEGITDYARFDLEKWESFAKHP